MHQRGRGGVAAGSRGGGVGCVAEGGVGWGCSWQQRGRGGVCSRGRGGVGLQLAAEGEGWGV